MLSSFASSINIYNQDGLTPLIQAVYNSDLGAVERLIHSHDSVNLLSRTTKNSPIMYLFCRQDKANDIAILRALISAGANLRHKDSKGATVLHQAARGYLNAIEILLASGADINALDKEELSPLEYAIRVGSIESVKLLLKHGAKIRAKTIHYAIYHNFHLPIFDDYHEAKKLWNIFSDKRGFKKAILKKCPHLSDGGSEEETIKHFREYLQSFVTENDIHRDILAKIDKLLDQANLSSWVFAYHEIDPHVVNIGGAFYIMAGYQNHAIAGLAIKKSESMYRIFLIDRGATGIVAPRAVDATKHHRNILPFRILNVPVEKLNKVLDTLHHTTGAEESPAYKSIFIDVPEITGSNYEIIGDIAQHPFRSGRCYIDNINSLIFLLMILSLGRDQGRLLFKQFQLHMETEAVRNYEAAYAGRQSPVDKEIIELCRFHIERKKLGISRLQYGLAARDGDHLNRDERASVGEVITSFFGSTRNTIRSHVTKAYRNSQKHEFKKIEEVLREIPEWHPDNGHREAKIPCCSKCSRTDIVGAENIVYDIEMRKSLDALEKMNYQANLVTDQLNNCTFQMICFGRGVLADAGIDPARYLQNICDAIGRILDSMHQDHFHELVIQNALRTRNMLIHLAADQSLPVRKNLEIICSNTAGKAECQFSYDAASYILRKLSADSEPHVSVMQKLI